jgi:hypothetical protein
MHKHATIHIGQKKFINLVSIYKNWPDDVQACTMSMEDFIKME